MFPQLTQKVTFKINLFSPAKPLKRNTDKNVQISAHSEVIDMGKQKVLVVQ